jgi:hypothetical protein
MLYLKLVGVFLALLGAGLATSFAEYKFNYSLYKTVFRVK